MARSGSPLLVIVIFLTVLSSIPMVVQAPVKSVETTTERPDYFIGERVEAKVIVDYQGLVPAIEVTFDWFDPIGTPIFNETVNMTLYPDDTYGAAFSNWTANMTGTNFTVRGTHNDTSEWSEAKFSVSSYEDIVVVDLLSISLSRPYYENNTVARATTTVGYLGNGSILDNVSFEWRYPNSTVAFTESLTLPDGGPNGTSQASSYWQVDFVGVGYEVQATYQGIQPLTDIAYFDVIPERVRTWKNLSISGSVTWAKSDSPFGVCANITVQSGATLTVEAGSVIKFCPDSGMTVRGTLVMDGRSDSPINLTSYSYPSNPGDWKSVTFEDESIDIDSILNHVIAEYSQRGFVFNSASPQMVNVSVANSSISGMEVYQSDVFFIGVNITDSGQGIYTSHSTLDLVDSEIQRCNDGIVMEDSDGTLEGNWVHHNTNRGIWAIRSNPTIRGNIISMNANKAIRVEYSQDLLVEGNAVSWSNFTFDSYGSFNLTLRESSFSNAAIVGLSFWTTDDALVENSTISSSTTSFRVAGGSTVRALNCTFDDTVVTVTGGSRLYVDYFLHVNVRDDSGYPLQDASITVSVNDVPTIISSTGTDGWSRWLVTRYETFSGVPGDPDRPSIRLDVDLDRYNITDSSRSLNMSSSRFEQFVGILVAGPSDGDGDGVDSFLLMIMAVVGGIVAAALAFFLIMFLRRRKKAEEPEEDIMDLELEDGKVYIVTQDGSERSFDRLVSELDDGSKGLCFTRTYPDNLRKQHSLGDAKVMWLSRDVEKGGLMPTNLGLITNEVDKFLRANEGVRRIVFIDGLEYLIAQNGFGKVLKLLNYLKDTMGVHSGILLIPFDIKSVEETEAAMLRADLEVI